MFDFFKHLFDTSGFPPRWYCGNWTAAHGWLHILSDLGVWSAYVAIPCVLIYFIVRKRDVPFRSIFWLFGAFILACGTTHFMEALIFWWPAYRLAGVIKLVTAVVSWATVLALVPVVPRALAMRSAEQLESEIAARKKAEDALLQANTQLERQMRESEQRLWLAVKIAEEQAGKNQEVFKLVHKIGRIGHWEWNATTGENKWTPEIEALYGLPPGGFAGDYQAWMRMLHPSDVVKAEQDVKRAFETGEYFTEFRVVWPDGSIHWLETRAKVFKDSAGKPARFLGVNMDITDRKRQETELHEKLREIDTLMDVAPVALVTTYDPTCRSITGNRAASELLKVPLRGNLSKSAPPDEQPPFLVFRHGKEAQAHELAVQVAAARGVDVRNEEQELRFHDGTVRHIVCHASPLFDERSRVRGCVGAILDVTEQKQAEAALREADRRKDEFLATLAHELRNPLAPVRTAVQILRFKGPTDEPEIQQARDMIDRQVGQMAHLLDDLLDVSRITRDRLELRRRRVDLSEVLRAAVEQSRPLIEANGHALTISAPNHPVPLDADPVRLAQVFTNLLNNAAKYTDHGGKLWLTAAVLGSEASVSVKDNGIGIPAEHLPRLFERFSQASATLERAQGGLGIGLSLVHGLVEKHGGRVEAHSAGPGQGSEFVVRLPILEEASPIEPAAQVSAVGPAPSAPRRILVVDDNQDAADSMALMLQLAGHEVQTAYDGLTALKTAEKSQPTVVLLDIGLPRMNGYEVARRIREQAWGKQMVLIAVTGWGQNEDKRRAAEVGFDHHLTKPVEPAEVNRLLAALP